MPRTVLLVTGWIGFVIAVAVIAAVVLFAPHVPIGAAIFLGCVLGFGMMCLMALVYARVWVVGKGIERVASTIARQKLQQPAPREEGPSDELFNRPGGNAGMSPETSNPFASPIAESDQPIIIRSRGSQQFLGLMLYGAAMIFYSITLSLAIIEMTIPPAQREQLAELLAVGFGLIGTGAAIAGYRVRRAGLGHRV